LISLIIPTIGRYAQIKSAIRKISSNQHISEIIIVEDKKCAESELLQTLAKVNIKVISNSGTPGAYGARLYGVKNSKSRFVMFLDSDDYVISDYINNALSHIIKNPGTIISTNQVHGDKIVLYSKYSPYRYDFDKKFMCCTFFWSLG
jgi:glycosyltransferase involved in cell wall biosynthesis